jgi:hypothetical protein
MLLSVMVISLECFTPQAFFPIRGWAAKNVSDCDPRCFLNRNPSDCGLSPSASG